MRSFMVMGLYLAILHEASEVLEGAVIGGFPFCVEAATRKFSHPEMIGDALAAHPFPGAGVVGAFAAGQVFFFVTFHRRSPPSCRG
jgi:hypothetical protein